MVPACRGVRGAIQVSENTAEAILSATRELLAEIVARNGIQIDDVAMAFFTLTPDLNADFPAKAAREIGWYETALMCAQELAVPNSLPRCIRVLILWNTTRLNSEIVHCYLKGAEVLRPERGLSTVFAPQLG
jgi:chorismate mutase